MENSVKGYYFDSLDYCKYRGYGSQYHRDHIRYRQKVSNQKATALLAEVRGCLVI